MNVECNENFQIRVENVEDVEQFSYLGSGGNEMDVKTYIQKENSAFLLKKYLLQQNWDFFKASVKSVLFFGCETWKCTKKIFHSLQTFINRCLTRILA
jgi:hypothetical protein